MHHAMFKEELGEAKGVIAKLHVSNTVKSQCQTGQHQYNSCFEARWLHQNLWQLLSHHQ